MQGVPRHRATHAHCRVLTLALLAVGCVPLAANGPASAATPTAVEEEDPGVLSLRIRGVGQLRFGEQFEWLLVTEPPAEPRRGHGIRQGGVSVRSADGRIRHVLPEGPAFSTVENGPACALFRVGDHAVIRCQRDYVFNTLTGAPPVLISPQFSDRINPQPGWLAELPLPWWRFTGDRVAGKPLAWLEYGWVNYGQAIASSEITRGPALLDLETGRIAIARRGSAADSPVYDEAEAAEDEPVSQYAERVVSDETSNGRRLVTVLTLFDRCVAATCRGDREPGFRRLVPLSYLYE